MELFKDKAMNIFHLVIFKSSCTSHYKRIHFRSLFVGSGLLKVKQLQARVEGIRGSYSDIFCTELDQEQLAHSW